MFDLLRKFLPLKEAYLNDPTTLWLNVVGGILIGFTFAFMGIIYVYMARRAKALKSKKRIVTTKLLGWSLIACAFSRFADVTCIWSGLFILSGWLKIITGVICLIVIARLPGVIRDAMTMGELKSSLDETREKLGIIENINKKLNG